MDNVEYSAENIEHKVDNKIKTVQSGFPDSPVEDIPAGTDADNGAGNADVQAGANGGADAQVGLDELLAQVEECIGQLENPQISLEDSFRYYERGIRQLKKCNEVVAGIEQKMQVINSEGRLEDF